MAVQEETSDIALMARVRKGDADAFEQLHARYQRRVLYFFHALAKNSHTANELCQECFLRVWKIRKRYLATGSFPAYLFGIARLIWLEECRAAGKQYKLGTREALEAGAELVAAGRWRPDARAESTELRERLDAALAELPEAQRMVFVMGCIQGLSLADIADALDCPVNTVRSRKILATKKLRHLLSHTFISSYGALPKET